MKSLFIITAISFSIISSMAHAGSHKECKGMEGLAKTIMTARQSGMPMSKLMESVDNVDFSKVGASSVKEEAGNIMKGVSKDMIILAYDKPKMSIKSNQQEYVTEFGDMFYSQCIQN